MRIQNAGIGLRKGSVDPRGTLDVVSSYAGEMEFIAHDVRGPSRRTVVVLVLLPALVLAGGYLADRHVRGTESAAVQRCAEEAHTTVQRRESRVHAMAAYVRPALYGRFPGAVGDGLLEMVSTEARAVVGTLDEARAGCAAVALLPHHSDLKQRRAACLAYLDEHAAFLSRAAADGLAVYRDSPGAGHDC